MQEPHDRGTVAPTPTPTPDTPDTPTPDYAAILDLQAEARQAIRDAVAWQGRAVLSIPEVAQIMGVHQNTVSQWVNRREIPSVRLGGRLYVPTLQLLRHLDEATRYPTRYPTATSTLPVPPHTTTYPPYSHSHSHPNEPAYVRLPRNPRRAEKAVR